MISQIKASDDWSYYQAKGIKAAVLNSKMEILAAEGKPATAADQAKAAQYVKDQADISKEALALQDESATHLQRHEKLASAVTFFQIGIAVSAIAVLTRRRLFWYVGLAFGASGLVFLAIAHVRHHGCETVAARAGVGTSTHCMPAARAAWMPVFVSSKTRHFSGATPRRCAAIRNGSGCGFPFS